jgi:putative ABC transport system permease protein
MWWNFTKTTLRALYRDKAYTLINIAGLAIGMACCLILGSYLHSELTYDLHHERHDRIYRIAAEYTIDGRTNYEAGSSPKLGPALAENFSEVEAFVRIQSLSYDGSAARLIRHDDDAFYWDDVYAVDESIFQIFTHNVLYGDPKTALADPSSVAVSRTFAAKYFGDINPIGELITLESGEQRTITLVFADLPANSHLKYDVLLSYHSLVAWPDDLRDFWWAADFTYVVMPANYSVQSFEAISDAIFARYMTDHGAYLNGTWRGWLQPLADIHLYSDVSNDRPTGNRFYLYGLGIVAVFILLVACINYVNLATARASKRAREIGMRKILGATRLSLVIQFLSESVILALVALVVAVILFYATLALTPIIELLGRSSPLGLAVVPDTFALIIGSSIAIGILAGAYPAFYLSSIAPLSALVGSRSTGTKNSRLREFLVLIQFTISIAVIGSTMIMGSQMRFLADQPLGFEKDGRLVITLHGADLIQKIPTIRTELEKGEHVIGVTATDRLMGETSLLTFFETENNDGEIVNVTTHMMPVNHNYLNVMGMELVEGRDFSLDGNLDDTIIVNEAVVRNMGWEQPIGKHMGLRNRTVIGVVKDFNFNSLHEAVEPIAIYGYRTNFESMPVEDRPFVDRFLIINIETSDMGRTLDFIEKTLAQFDLMYPFQYRFFDEVLGEQYLSEERLMKLIGMFSAICVFIACLGLLGLTAFTTTQRTKEIGIRKVLGATTFQIILLLSRKVLMLVAIGSVIASLIAYIAMDAWLETFAHRISIGPGVFVASAAVALIAAFATVAIQSYRTAQGHPVDALRYE